MKIGKQHIFAILPKLFYAITLCWLAYAYFNGWIDTAHFFNSDALSFPSLFKNVFTDGKNFSDWVMPPSPFLFPDAILYALAYFLSPHVQTQILIFAILQSLAFFTYKRLIN